MELRPHGVSRVVVPAFLSVWLMGWLAGELFVLKALLGVIGVTFEIPFIDADVYRSIGDLSGYTQVAFLLVWFVLWTFGGIAAIVLTLRLLFGRDVVELTPSGFAVRQATGPLERVIEFHRQDVTELRIKPPDGAILAVVKGRSVDVTRFGTSEERILILERIRDHTGIPPSPPRETGFPDGWLETREPDGTFVYTNKWVTSATYLTGCAVLGFACIAAAVVPVAFMGIEREGSHAFRAIVGVVLLLLTSFLRTANDVWRIGKGRIDVVRTLGPLKRTTAIRDAILHVRYRLDDDNDEQATLLAIAQAKERRLYSRMSELREVAAMGRRVAEITGWDLTIDPLVEP